jgi:hypothetical protein
LEDEAAAAEKKRSEDEAAAAEKKRLEDEAAAAEKKRLDEEAAELERQRIEAERIAKEEAAASGLMSCPGHLNPPQSGRAYSSLYRAENN